MLQEDTGHGPFVVNIFTPDEVVPLRKQVLAAADGRTGLINEMDETLGEVAYKAIHDQIQRCAGLVINRDTLKVRVYPRNNDGIKHHVDLEYITSYVQPAGTCIVCSEPVTPDQQEFHRGIHRQCVPVIPETPAAYTVCINISTRPRAIVFCAPKPVSARVIGSDRTICSTRSRAGNRPASIRLRVGQAVIFSAWIPHYSAPTSLNGTRLSIDVRGFRPLVPEEEKATSQSIAEDEEDISDAETVECNQPERIRLCRKTAAGIHEELDSWCEVCDPDVPRVFTTFMQLEVEDVPGMKELEHMWTSHTVEQGVPSGTLARLWSAINLFVKPVQSDILLDWGVGSGKVLLSADYLCTNGAQLRKIGIEVHPDRVGTVKHVVGDTRLIVRGASSISTNEWARIAPTIVVHHQPTVLHERTMQTIIGLDSVRAIFSTHLNVATFRSYFTPPDELVTAWTYVVLHGLDWGHSSCTGYLWYKVPLLPSQVGR